MILFLIFLPNIWQSVAAAARPDPRKGEAASTGPGWGLVPATLPGTVEVPTIEVQPDGQRGAGDEGARPCPPSNMTSVPVPKGGCGRRYGESLPWDGTGVN